MKVWPQVTRARFNIYCGSCLSRLSSQEIFSHLASEKYLANPFSAFLKRTRVLVTGIKLSINSCSI